ncbi:hypothetical protein PsorP6_007897 [Peronosclerospora sorghi]|uniref:Uncharacterized protein n=1 Tax=Peronosclerospora sorghi TaxID=230839 RepID=A0ACC0WAI2_9STRA|nr:hypothetical protein PsorP6_007897 [Peronosclerospora sorghi]
MLDDDDAYVIIETTRYFQQLEGFVTDATTTLETLQAVLTFHTLSTYAGALSDARILSFLDARCAAKPRARHDDKPGVDTVSDKLPTLVGKYYALVRFDCASHDVARDLMTTMHRAWATTLPRVAWLDAATQQAATTKLRAMSTRLGHATQSEHADALLATNLLKIRAHQYTVAVKKLGRSVDRTEWTMTSADVNAYYYWPRANQMVFFPAGILQPPFFSKEYDPARNCGSFGSIVGHELAHGFDATGRHYDASGTLHDWWRSNETAHEFTKRTQYFVEQSGRYNVSSTTDPTHVLCHVNGQYTLSENIADNGGINLAFHAYQAARATSNATRDKLFFLSCAQT